MSDSRYHWRLPSFAGLIGVARADITPPAGIFARNWGAATHDVAEGVHRPLSLTVLTLQHDQNAPPLVLAAMDGSWWRRPHEEWELRSTLLSELDLQPAWVLINLSHTHAGPSLCREDADKPGGHLIAPYLVRLRDALLTATREAMASATPATLEWTTGRCALARHRDLPDPEADRVVCGFDPAGPADDTLLVGRVTRGDTGGLLATLVNYACHPVTLAWENRLISPDFAGAMRVTVEARTGGAPCLFLQGASGELAPREVYTADTSVPDRHGRSLGYAVVSALEEMPLPRTGLEYAGVVESGAPLATWRQTRETPPTTIGGQSLEVELSLVGMPSLAEMDAQLATCADRALAERIRRRRRIRAAVGEGTTTKMPLWVWSVGDAIVVASPNEAYSQLQTELRRRFPGTAIVVMNVTNGHTGYLPPAELYGRDIYQVWQTPFAAGSLERVIEAASAAIREILERQCCGAAPA